MRQKVDMVFGKRKPGYEYMLDYATMDNDKDGKGGTLVSSSLETGNHSRW
jgi:hypothetical protein